MGYQSCVPTLFCFENIGKKYTQPQKLDEENSREVKKEFFEISEKSDLKS